MSEEKRSGGLGQEGQGAVFQAHRPGQPRHFGAGDVLPMQHQSRIGEAGPGEGVGSRLAGGGTDGGGAAAPPIL